MKLSAHKVYAGIGSRQTPPETLVEIRKLGAILAENGAYIRSGHAEGADYAWEYGAQDRCIVYLPWTNFNRHLMSYSRHTFTPSIQAHQDAKIRAADSVARYHPFSSSIRGIVTQIMERNYYQIMGMQEQERPVNAVICWAITDVSGGVKGGTGQAVRIAQAHTIPIYNLYRESGHHVLEKIGLPCTIEPCRVCSPL